MKIQIEQKYAPFSQSIGEVALIPMSDWSVKAFPARLEFFHPVNESFFVTLDVEGPISHFILMQNQERGWIRVSYMTPKGHLSYRVFVREKTIIFFVERCGVDGISMIYQGKKEHLFRKEELSFPALSSSLLKRNLEKMSFGNHKAQDWQMIKRRLQLDEILPIWFHLGQSYQAQKQSTFGISELLLRCEELLAKQDKIEIGKSLLTLFQAGFQGIFSPRLEDTDYQGLLKTKDSTLSPLLVLKGGAEIIRRLLIDKCGDAYSILPCLPVELHAGRFIKVHEDNISFDLEWSKKMIRRVKIRVEETQECNLIFQSQIKSFRLRSSPREKGNRLLVGVPLLLKGGTHYFLDCFQK